MARKDEEIIASFRCKNKPVKYIAKNTGIKREEIEKIIKRWIIETDPYLDGILKKYKSSKNVSGSDIAELIQGDPNIFLQNEDVLDYIARNRGNHHDRYMDCIRYKIYSCIIKKQ
ncbi:hypothetical protein [Acidiplasma sp.]|jgi:hypothetical protein|uniref:hypothetical protein n=1 Tax=Acidiplasma TaxID=507753 RepID=UPI00258E5139|nr:hypothetical protein [Acidiplasma sp.]